MPLLGIHEVVFAPVMEEQARGALRLAKLGFEIFLSSFQVRPGTRGLGSQCYDHSLMNVGEPGGWDCSGLSLSTPLPQQLQRLAPGCAAAEGHSIQLSHFSAESRTVTSIFR